MVGLEVEEMDAIRSDLTGADTGANTGGDTGRDAGAAAIERTTQRSAAALSHDARLG